MAGTPPGRPFSSSRHSRTLSLPPPLAAHCIRLARRSLQPPPNTSDIVSAPAHIPLAAPPFMPMYKASTETTPVRLVKLPPSPRQRRPSTGVKEDLWTGLPSTVATAPRTSAPSSPKSSHSASLKQEGLKLRRRLQRWTHGGSRDRLDFGCAGEWTDGPADMSDSYYSRYPGGANRASTSSSDYQPAWTHSRGPSSSSNYSVSTAASSMPPSPTLNCALELPSPKASRVPLTPRTAHRKRMSDEIAGLDAVNEYFQRVRLSQIEEDVAVSPRGSRRESTIRASLSTVKPPKRDSMASPVTGLAIFGDDEADIGFEGAPLDRSSPSLHHARSISHDLEIEFIETGHTTFTPLTFSDDEEGDSSTTIIIPEDVLLCPSRSSLTLDAADVTPCTVATFETSESVDSCDSAVTASTIKPLAHQRSSIPEDDICPALDELSEYFSSTNDLPSLATSYASSASSCCDTSDSGYYSNDSRAASFKFPPVCQRFASVSSLPTPHLQQTPLVNTTRHKRGAASFAAAERAKLVATGQATPTMAERHVSYEWI
ncbi:hypothetical protein Rt10032_c05g2265 [Rhodotorula toruloides]|uniref:Uncharacterized protein n=1 Tax=Rhodotorula toruloides TaxID=5286 RepID=A0A511KCZ8_RHOTO|nr:hypothetical protein Rt10032_c05g2265 [Rhodotorula toruloides]